MMHALVIVTAAAATLIWRIAGAGIAHRIHLEHPLYRFFAHISYASVAAILLRNLLVSGGELSGQDVVVRFVALLAGLVVCRMRPDGVLRGLVMALVVFAVLDGFFQM